MEDYLSQFGQLFISQVRDQSLLTLDHIVSGHMKDERSQELHRLLRELPASQMQLLRDFAAHMVDQTLHNALLMFERNASWVIASPQYAVQDINQLSDGLCGEL